MKLSAIFIRYFICLSLVMTTSLHGSIVFADSTSSSPIAKTIQNLKLEISKTKFKSNVSTYTSRNVVGSLEELSTALDRIDTSVDANSIIALARANSSIAIVLQSNVLENDLEIFEKLVLLSKLMFDEILNSEINASKEESMIELASSVGKMIYQANEPFEDVLRRPSYYKEYSRMNPLEKSVSWMQWGFLQVFRDIGSTLSPVSVGYSNGANRVSFKVPIATPFIGEASQRASSIEGSVKLLTNSYSSFLKDKNLSEAQKALVGKAILASSEALEDVEPTRYRLANRVAKWTIIGLGFLVVMHPPEIWTGWRLTADSPLINAGVWTMIFAMFHRARNVTTGSNSLKYYDRLKGLAKEVSCKYVFKSPKN